MSDRTKASAVLVALEPVARVGISIELTMPSTPSIRCVSGNVYGLRMRGLTRLHYFHSVFKSLLGLRTGTDGTNRHHSCYLVLDCDLTANNSSHGCSDNNRPVQ